uniref:TPX2 C-terminal domain-containing protein n=1 Tax=Dunaliella tertiolecta TaxID=3047 RepID=A0A7S3QWQ4_DUNTE
MANPGHEQLALVPATQAAQDLLEQQPYVPQSPFEAYIVSKLEALPPIQRSMELLNSRFTELAARAALQQQQLTKLEQQQQHMDEERTPEPEDHQLRYGDQDEGNHRFSYGDEQITPGAENGKEQQSGEAEEQEGEEGRDAQATAAEDGQHQQEEDGDSGAAAAAMAAAAAAVPVPAEAPRRASLDKQGSAGSGGKGGYAQLPAMELSHSMPSFKENSSPEARIPSYLRATTSFKAHTGKLVPEKSPSPEASPSASRSASARKVNTASSRLLAPTASYLTHINSARKDSKAAREAAEAAEREKKARELKKVMESPQGQRVTKAQPFRFKTEEQPKTVNQLTSEERAFLEAQKHAWRRHEVPKHIKESRPIEGVRVHSTPKSPQDVFKPFQLASLEKHEKYRQRAEQRQAEEKRKAEEERKFRAQELDRKMLEQPATPKPRSPPPVTQSQEFRFSSEERVKLHKTVLDPARRSRLSQAEREKLEAHEAAIREEEFRQKEAKAAALAQKQREKELEKMDISEYRKSLTFKAGSMPSFKSPFRADLSKSQRVTDSIEFNFHTDRKLGKPKSPNEREDAAAPQLPGGNFYNSLRSSTNQLHSPGSMRASMRSSMRASSARGLAGSNSLRNSTNSLPLSAQRGSARPASARVGSGHVNQGVEAH